jgi:hypothetical protein
MLRAVRFSYYSIKTCNIPCVDAEPVPPIIWLFKALPNSECLEQAALSPRLKELPQVDRNVSGKDSKLEDQTYHPKT